MSSSFFKVDVLTVTVDLKLAAEICTSSNSVPAPPAPPNLNLKLLFALISLAFDTSN